MKFKVVYREEISINDIYYGTFYIMLSENDSPDEENLTVCVSDYDNKLSTAKMLEAALNALLKGYYEKNHLRCIEDPK